MLRPVVAFLIAPLAVPLFTAIKYAPWEVYRPFNLFMIHLSMISAYAGAFVFGIPAYLFLRARKWTAFWFAPVAGFVVASLSWWIVGIVVALAGGSDLYDIRGHLDWLREVPWPYGPLGAFVGVLLWLVARPDRGESHDAASRRTRSMRFWAALALGFVGGAMVWYLLSALFAISYGIPLCNVIDIDPGQLVLRWLWPVGPAGAVVGGLLWLVARPGRDRRDRSHEPEDRAAN